MIFYLKQETHDKYRLQKYMEKIKALDFKTYVHGHCPPMMKEEIFLQLESELR